ncbi:Gfo/Idh/MocA family protein [Paenibacillus sp. CF384]|uniref:Gfo/Idh/MocA family protein n=1 Tax=Paenibacillus sp. CF384 TaxID=1884382 RepID=UPI00089B2EC1|nr:Gfo/Idh/MocA family oxidoreductase [Paenibacillus sp. CF384]SDX04661.1 Predicted dehydrogenase [Paenibacillus sp. CF384]
MIRVAMLSYWHVHAWDYTNQVQANPNLEVAAIWDELPVRGQEIADQLGVPFFANLDELLARTDIDAVVVDAPTNMHRDVMVKAARAGKHIFTEKVVAATLREVNEIKAAVREAGVKFTVSMFRLNERYTPTIKGLIDQGLFGQLTQVRVRNAHNGTTGNWLPDHFYNLEQCQGGALIDLGCHPVYLTRYLLGLPQSVTASFGYVTGKEVEDNATVTLQYENGAVGILETGYLTPHSPFCIEIHGTEGTLLYGVPDDVIRVRSNKLEQQEWVTIDHLPDLPTAIEQWVGHIMNDTQPDENNEFATDLTRVMEAAYLSVAEKRVVSLAELHN